MLLDDGCTRRPMDEWMDAENHAISFTTPPASLIFRLRERKTKDVSQAIQRIYVGAGTRRTKQDLLCLF